MLLSEATITVRLVLPLGKLQFFIGCYCVTILSSRSVVAKLHNQLLLTLCYFEKKIPSSAGVVVTVGLLQQLKGCHHSN